MRRSDAGGDAPFAGGRWTREGLQSADALTACVSQALDHSKRPVAGSDPQRNGISWMERIAPRANDAYFVSVRRCGRSTG